MPQPVLIDSSVWVEVLRPGGDEALRREVRTLVAEGAAVFSDLVLLELWNGARGEAEQRFLASLEEELESLPTTAEVWHRSRALARTCRAAGVTVPATDLLVAACAAHHGAALLHRDRHFDLVRDAVS
jgi:predicted nucleic acid-binding protein